MLDAIGEIALRQHGDAGHHDRAELETGRHGNLPLGAARQHDDDPIALDDAPFGERVGDTVGRPGDIGEGETRLGAGRVAPDERRPLAIGGQGVDHVGAEIESLRNLPAEVRAGLRVVAHGRKLPRDVHDSPLD